MSKKQPAFMIKRKIQSDALKKKRKDQMSSLELLNIERRLEERKSKPKPKQRKLISVYRGVDARAKDYCYEMKGNPTDSEKRIHSLLKSMKLPAVFQMPVQHSYGFYIADFYIPKINLILEIDGKYHEQPAQKERDIRRDRFMVYKGFQVLRITNEVADCITKQELRKLLYSS